MRIGKSLVTFGCLLIVLSFMNSGTGGMGSIVGPDTFEGFWIRTGGDFLLKVESDNGSLLSIYVLDYVDTLTVLNTSSMEHTSPILDVINVTSFYNRVPISFPGLYSVLVTAPENDTRMSIHIEPILPMLPITFSGLGLLTLGMVIILKRKFG